MFDRITVQLLLDNEKKRVKHRTNSFEERGITDLFDRMLRLLQDLLSEVHRSSSASPLVGGAMRVNGALVPSWNLRLLVHMFAGSLVQFAFAISHIYRAQAHEAYGHVRHAIENSGIAYLSKSEPDIVAFYKTGDDYEMSKRYPKRKLLPRTNDLTRDLNRMMGEASRHCTGISIPIQ